MTPELMTIGPSHYCEKARWALERHGLDFVERRHPPAFHVAFALRRGGRRTVPVLTTEAGALNDSREIARWADARGRPEGRLIPAEPELAGEVEAWERRFDAVLGPATRRLAYFYLLPEPSLAPTMTVGVGAVERSLFRLLLPGVKLIMRRAMRIDRAGAERSRVKVHEVCGAVDEALADGRRYLVGERFTLADLTFASLAAPVVWPEEYGFAELPGLEETPLPFRELVAKLRARPCGAYLLRLYAEERAPRRLPGEPP